MNDVEETIVFDALAAIEAHSEVLRALAQRDHSPAAIAAYRDGVYSVGIKLQVLLGPEAIARGKARREKIRKEAIAFFAQRQPQQSAAVKALRARNRAARMARRRNRR